ncbi:MAG TPA: peptidase MA family metallohydrolase [Candidatus Omnitrophota bacterium]|nr:peptidase MA family metallohydrolase [Candidatus Omnitrophota bacterium]
MKKNIFIFFIVCCFFCVPAQAQEWNQHKSQHFVVYYKEAPVDFVKTVADNAEHYYQEIYSNLGFTRNRYWTADDRTQIYIYDDADDFVTEAREAHWSSGSALVRSKIIRTFPSAHGFFDSTLPHELGHIIFRELIGLDTQVPLWFEEGVAMYQEKAKRWGANQAVQQAMEQGEFIPLKELASFRPNQGTERKKVELFYAESASIVYYLIREQGSSRFLRLCRKLKDGVLFEEALKSVYIRFKNIDELDAAWEAYLKK